MKIALVLVLMGVLCLSFVSADLIIHTQPLQISQKINEDKAYQMILENTFDFKISEFEFSDISEFGFNFPEIVMEPNSTKNIDFTVAGTSAFHGQKISKISFKFKVEIPEETQTHYINITNTPEEYYNIIRDGDTVIWSNLADGNREVTSGSFNSQIVPNGTFQHVFNQVGLVNWQVFTSGMAWHYGVIDVINKTSEEMANNPSYDKDWTLNIDITSKPTNISGSLSKEDYEVEYMTFKKGLLTIENTGEEVAERLTFSSDSEWVSFNKDEIDLNPGDEDWAEFTITPLIMSTNQTNQTYSMSIIAKASNSNEIIKQISVFIPYKEITNEIGDSDVEFMNWLDKVYCPGHPSSIFCDPETGDGGNGSIVYKDVVLPVNMTATSLYDIFKRLQRVEDTIERTNNDMKITNDNLNSQLPAIMNMTNRSLEIQTENEKSERTRKNATWIIAFFVMIIVMIGSIIRKVGKKSYKKAIAEGAHRYRR